MIKETYTIAIIKNEKYGIKNITEAFKKDGIVAIYAVPEELKIGDVTEKLDEWHDNL